MTLGRCPLRIFCSRGKTLKLFKSFRVYRSLGCRLRSGPGGGRTLSVSGTPAPTRWSTTLSLKGQVASQNQLQGLLWCEFGHVTLEISSQRNPLSPPSGFLAHERPHPRRPYSRPAHKALRLPKAVSYVRGTPAMVWEFGSRVGCWGVGVLRMRREGILVRARGSGLGIMGWGVGCRV